MHVIVGATPRVAGASAYSASMNSYLPLTDAPSRSTLLLFRKAFSISSSRLTLSTATVRGGKRILAAYVLRRSAVVRANPAGPS
jgi:hypothetical protein